MSNTGSGVADGLAASPSYPRTRSQTARPQPVLKRKGSDITRAKPQKAAKIVRAGPSLSATPSVDTSPEATVEPPVDVPAAATARTLWPPEVPRSMLFTFRVGPSAFQMYDGVKRRSALDVSPASDTSQFAATGSEPMFDNSWRVSFIESAHTPQQNTNIATTSEQRRIHNSSGRFVSSSPTSSRPTSTPSCSTRISPSVGSVLHSMRRDGRVRDENAFPMIRGLELVRVDAPKHADDDDMLPPRRDPPTPLSPSRSLTQNRQHDLQSFSGAHSVFPSPIPLVVSGGGLVPVAERMPHGGPFPTYPPAASSSPSLLLSGVSSGVGSGGPPSVFGPCPAFFPGHTPSRPAHSSPPMTPLSAVACAAPSLRRASGSGPPSMVTHASTSHHEPHIPMFSLPPHPGLYPTRARPPYPPFGHHQPSHIPAIPHAQSPSVSMGVEGTHHAATPSAPTHVFRPAPIPPSYGHPRGTPPIILPPPVPRHSTQERSSGPSAPWSMFYECIKNGRNALRGPGKGRRRAHQATNEGPQAQVVDHDLSRLEAAVDSRTMGPSHKCPFCPRTFPLANGLTIHLKWHWGASGLEWKRGKFCVALYAMRVLTSRRYQSHR